jgi:hypothetical protein
MIDFNAIHPSGTRMQFSTVTVAQHVSRVIEEVGDLQVGAQLSHGSVGTESFEVQAPSGQVFRVCVVPIPVHLSSEFKPETTETQAPAAPALSVGATAEDCCLCVLNGDPCCCGRPGCDGIPS